MQLPTCTDRKGDAEVTGGRQQNYLFMSQTLIGHLLCIPHVLLWGFCKIQP